MKVFLILSAFFLAAKAGKITGSLREAFTTTKGKLHNQIDILTQEWKLFKEKYGKSYNNLGEEVRRMRTFIENKLFVAHHNERYRRGEETFEVELNYLADRLPEEWDAIFGLIIRKAKTFIPKVDIHAGMKIPKLIGERFAPIPNVSVPEEVNWVKAGAVTNVKDQKQCASCYAFSVAGSLEGQMFLKKKKKLKSLSVQNILDCSENQGNKGCNGGSTHWAFEYINQSNGINSEENYPYESTAGACRFKSDKVVANCVGYVKVENDENILKEAVATVGPISICIDSSQKGFHLYKSGVYSDTKCVSDKYNHAVLLVGYGVDPVSRKDYWLVKNSWGTSWGEEGYGKIARNANNMCGIASVASYPKV